MPIDPPANASTPLLDDEEEYRRLIDLCNRTLAERAREYKYRFSQSMVFGLPVIALQVYGRALGPTDWERWVSLLQLLLAGWIVYVNLGMFFEGVVMLWWRQWSWGLPVVTLAGAAYGYSAVGATAGIISGVLPYRLLFDGCVALLAAWTGWQWMRLARAARRDALALATFVAARVRSI